MKAINVHSLISFQKVLLFYWIELMVKSIGSRSFEAINSLSSSNGMQKGRFFGGRK